jgi:hypothetical protein
MGGRRNIIGRLEEAALIGCDDDVSLVAFPFFESCLSSNHSNHFSTRTMTAAAAAVQRRNGSSLEVRVMLIVSQRSSFIIIS